MVCARCVEMKKKPLLLTVLVIATIAGISYIVSPNDNLWPSRKPSPATISQSPAAILPGAEEFGLTKAELVKNIEAVEQGIASCMKTTGFQYIPADYLTVRKSMDADKKIAGLTDDEFRSQFGYGISTQNTKLGTAPQLSGADHAATIGLGSQNVQLFINLSASNQVAYNRSLFGENTTATFAVSLEAEDFSQVGGCTRTAIEQVFNRDQLGGAYTNPGDVLIAQDSRVIAATAKWASCIRKAGFNYNNPEEIEKDLQDRLTSITGEADPSTLAPDIQKVLTELQGEERAIAVADFDCAEEFIEPVVVQVETELYGAPQN